MGSGSRGRGGELSLEHEHEIEEAFALFDKPGSGSIPTKDLKVPDSHSDSPP